jgi:hypothetical protein
MPRMIVVETVEFCWSTSPKHTIIFCKQDPRFASDVMVVVLQFPVKRRNCAKPKTKAPDSWGMAFVSRIDDRPLLFAEHPSRLASARKHRQIPLNGSSLRD